MPGFGGVCDPDGGMNASPGECGSLELSTDSPRTRRVDFSGDIVEPIVVAPALTRRDPEPAHPRVASVDRTGFSVEIEEWNYLDGAHGTERLDWVAVPAGRGVWTGDAPFEAGAVEVGADPVQVRFEDAVPAPRVWASEVTRNGGAPVVVRLSDLSGSGFSLRLQREEAAEDPPVAETVHWLAVASAPNDPDRARWAVGRLTGVTDQPVELQSRLMQAGLSDPAALIVFMSSLNGEDTAWARLIERSESDPIRVFVEEEQSSDGETGHTEEQIDWLACPELGPFDR